MVQETEKFDNEIHPSQDRTETQERVFWGELCVGALKQGLEYKSSGSVSAADTVVPAQFESSDPVCQISLELKIVQIFCTADEH